MRTVDGKGRSVAPIRILNYAINGLGLGHLTRLIAINRQIRRLSMLLAPAPAEITFLTSSEADTLAYANQFAAFKIPAKGIVASCGLDATRYRKIGKQWVWNAINLISPDILIVDTFPTGSFNELYDILDFGQKNVFIYRAVRPEAARHPGYQSALRGYQKIIQPQEQGENDSPVPEGIEDRVVTVGEILLRSSSEIFSRSEAREALGLPWEGQAVYISTGGGGDIAAESVFAEMIAAARALPEVRFIVGAGPLYRGREFAAPNVTWSYRHTMIEYFRAFDAAITAGGFNSVNELMHCGIPCVFLPQPRSHDDQEQRVHRCVSAGAGVLLESLKAEAIVASLSALLLSETQTAMSAAAANIVPTNHALSAAEEVLNLLYPADEVEEATLLCDPVVLMEAQTAGISEESMLRAARFFWRLQTEPLSAETADTILSATLRYLTVSHHGLITVEKALTALRKIKDITEIESIMDAALQSQEEVTN